MFNPRKISRHYAAVVFPAFAIFIAATLPVYSQSNPGVQVSGSPANNDCAKFVVSGGFVNSITTAGVPCGGSPGGSNTQVQYNNLSSFGGISGATSNGASITFGNDDLLLAGSSSGAMTLEAPAAASNYIQRFQAATDTIVDRATTDTLSNKSIAGSEINSGTVLGTYLAAINLAASGNGGVTGNLPVGNFNGGTGASAATFWGGGGAWTNAITNYFLGASGTAVASGGSTQAAYCMSSASPAICIYFGTGTPTVSAAQGSLYLNAASAAATLIYVNTSSGAGTTWTSAPAAAVTAIGGQSGAFTLSGGLSTNIPYNENYLTGSPPAFSPNAIQQVTGPKNVLADASLTGFAHEKILNADQETPGGTVIGFASGTAAISGATLTVSGTVTGTIALWQHVTDAANFTTNSATAAGNGTLHFASTTGISAGMWVYDITNPLAIEGDITVSSTTGTTVVLSGNVGKTPNGYPGTYPGVSSGDVIAFSTVLQGTHILQYGVQSFTTNNTTASGNAILHFASTTGIVAGMTIVDVTAGNSVIPFGTTVLLTTGTTVVMSANAGGSGVGSGDTVKFTTAGGDGPYVIDTSQSVSSETMQFHGGWAADQIYADPTGSGTIRCSPFAGTGSAFLPSGVNCVALSGSSISDIAYHFLADNVDATGIVCSLYAGPAGVCVGTNIFIQPVTFSIAILYGGSNAAQPWFESKMPCPATVSGCNPDNWATATEDVPPTNGYVLNDGGSPVQGIESWTFLPAGTNGGYDAIYHTGAVPAGGEAAVVGVDLKQTPGVPTCPGGASLPCFNSTPPPLEIPEYEDDLHRMQRFEALLGSGNTNGFNPENNSAIENTIGYAYGTNDFHANWPLPTTMRCDVWNIGDKVAPTCPKPQVYFNCGNSGVVGDVRNYQMTINGPTTYNASSVSVTSMSGLQTLQLDGYTPSTMTAQQVGDVSLYDQCMILVDSSVMPP